MLTMIGSYGWINLHAVQSVERKDNGHAIIHMTNGTVIPLLPDEAEDLERALKAFQSNGRKRTGYLPVADYETR